MRKIIVASGSFYIQKILESLGVEYDIKPDDSKILDKYVSPNAAVADLAKTIAYRKADNISLANPNFVFMASHTDVYVNKDKVAFPKNNDQVKLTLTQLSGKECSLITGYCVIDNLSGKVVLRSFKETVRIKPINDEEINNYVADNKFFDTNKKPLFFFLNDALLEDKTDEENTSSDPEDLRIKELFVNLDITRNEKDKDTTSPVLVEDDDDEEEEQDDDKNLLKTYQTSNSDKNITKNNDDDQGGEKSQLETVKSEDDNGVEKRFDKEERENEEKIKKLRLELEREKVLKKARKEKEVFEIEKERVEKKQKGLEERERKDKKESDDKKSDDQANSVKKIFHKKKRTKKERSDSDGDNEVVSTIVDIIGWFFEADIIVRLIVAAIAGILVFGFIFTSMGLLSGF